MNRIERLVWEETQLQMIERSQRRTHGIPGAKVVAIIALAGAVALLASRMTMPHLDDVMVQALTPASIVYAPAAAPNSTSDARRATPAPSCDPADKDDP